MTLEERVARLERKNRGLLIIASAAAVAAIVAAGVAMSAGVKTSKEVAREAPVAPPPARVEASPPPDPAPPAGAALVGRSLVLTDEHGKPRVTLGTDAHGTGLVLQDAEGVERLRVGLSPHGAPEVTLSGKDGEAVVRLKAFAGGTASLIIDHHAADTQLWLGTWAGGGTRLSFGRGGKTAIDLLDHGGSPRINVVPSTGMGGIGMMVHEEGWSSLTISDKEGTELWRAPVR